MESLNTGQLCIACQNNDAYRDFDDGDIDVSDPANMPYLLCPVCMQDAMTFIYVRDLMSDIGEYDIPLSRALFGLEEYDQVNNALCRINYVPFVDSVASAHDEHACMPPDELQERIARAFMPMIRAAAR